MPPLDRALALAEGDDRTLAVGEQLDLDMARPLDVALEEDAVVAERRLRLAACGRQRVVQLCRLPHHPHPAATAASGRLGDHRVADLLGIAGRDDGDAGSLRDPLRLELVSAQAKSLGGRPDERELGGFHGGSEPRILGEEAVSGMDRVSSGLLRRTDVLLRVEVRRDLDRLVGRAGME